MKGDAAIAILSTAALAIGTIIAQKSTGLGGDVCNYMFGSTSIFAMTPTDFFSTVILAFIMLALYFFFYHKFFLVSFDESFGKAIGVRVSIYNTMLAVLTASTIVIGMKMMGAMLISSLIVFPCLTAMRLWKTFRSVTLAATLISVVTYMVGFILSIVLSTPPGATIVMVDIVVFLTFILIESIQNKFKRGNRT
jgi:zinc transport system permease protein